MFFGNVREVEEGVNKVLGVAEEGVSPPPASRYGATGHANGHARKTPGIRFLVLDLTHVVGVDMSALEGLVRVRRTLEKRAVCLVICGVRRGVGPVGRALDSFFGHDVGERGHSGEVAAAQVEVFDTFGDAMECQFLCFVRCYLRLIRFAGTENAYLRVWFRSQKVARGVPFRRLRAFSTECVLTGLISATWTTRWRYYRISFRHCWIA